MCEYSRSRRVLLVDDEQMMQFALAEYLSRHAYEVDRACEREEAESLLLHGRYDLVIADLRLRSGSQLDGLELIEFIGRHAPNSKIVILTGNSSLAVEAEALQRGADVFLRKPQVLSQLVPVIDRLVGRVREESVG